MNKKIKFYAVINRHHKVLTVNVPLMNGGVQTNKFCPNELLTGGLSYLTPLQGELEQDFIQDCQNILTGAEATGKNDDRIDAFIGGLMGTVMNHFNRCGRLIFGDLLIYMDCFALLLEADGVPSDRVRNIYIDVLRCIVKLYDEKVLNTINLAPLKDTSLYTILFSPTLK